MKNAVPVQTVIQKVLKIALIAVFGAVILTPLVLLPVLGPDATALNSEKRVDFPKLSLSSVWSGTFQPGFDSWLNQNFPLRSKMVVQYRQLSADFEQKVSVIPALPDNDTGTGPSTDNPFYFDEEKNIYAKYNLIRSGETPVEPAGFKGSNAVNIGKSGYLFESNYINEYLGYTEPYISVTDEQLGVVLDKLEYITEQLAQRGITVVYVNTPSKAAHYSEYIPNWYKSKYEAAENYSRPYDRFKELLADSIVNYVDATSVCEEKGIYHTFPKTGIHWNKLAAFETTKRIIEVYEEASGNTARHLAFDNIIESTDPPGFGNPEQDVYDILYGIIDKEGSIVDDMYFWPDAYISNYDDAEPIGILVQGGSFCWDFTYYYNEYRIADTFKQFYYNAPNTDINSDPFGDGGLGAWDAILEDIDLVILEENENNVRGRAADPGSLDTDSLNLQIGSNAIYESLYQYLLAAENK